MNRRIIRAGVSALALLAFSACTTPLNPTLLQDGQLVVAALQAIDADAVALGAPAADTALIAVALTAVQTGLTDLQKGSKTPQDFATLLTDEINSVAPTLLMDLHANQTITTGVVLLKNLIPVIVADVTAGQKAPTAASIDTRGRMRVWIDGQKR